VQVQAYTGAEQDWGNLFSDEEIADPVEVRTSINATESQVDQQMMGGTDTQKDAPAIFNNPPSPTVGFDLDMPWKEFKSTISIFFGSDVQVGVASRKRKLGTQTNSVEDREAEAEVPAAGTSPSLGSACTGPLSMAFSKAVEADSPPRGGRRHIFSSNPSAAAFPAAGSSRRGRGTGSCCSRSIKTTPVADQPSRRLGQSSANSSLQHNSSAEVPAKRMKLDKSQVT